MSSIEVKSPYEIIPATDGTPLENGKIYVGTFGQDPESNPITVYWDEALTITATQPIPTIGGYPARSGSPSKIFTATSYSIRVKDKNNLTLYTELSVDPFNSNTEIKNIDTYANLRLYTGAITTIRITGDTSLVQPRNIAGIFQYDSTDTTTADNGGTVIVDSSNRRWKRVHNVGEVYFDWWEPDPTNTNDNATKLQSALDYVASLGFGTSTAYIRRAGATLHISNGAYRLESEITINPAVYKIKGNGRFKTYPQVFVYEPNMLTTFVPVFTGSQVFKIAPGASEVSFKMEDFNIATLETGNYPTRAIGFDCTGTEFQRDFTLERVGIFGFTAGSAIETFGATGIQSIGTLKIQDCAINRNGYILRCLDSTFINIFRFAYNEAGQNNTGGIELRGHAAYIVGNSLESNDNTILLSGTFRSQVIAYNYFEANGGSYVIALVNTKGTDVGPNFYSTITATEKIRLLYAVDVTINESDIYPNTEAASNPVTRNNSFELVTNAVTMPNSGGSVVQGFDNALKLDDLPPGVTEIGGFDQTETTYTSTGTGIITHVKSGLSIPTSSYLAVAFVVEYDDAPVESPRIELRPNSTNTDGQCIGVFFEFTKVSLGTDGKRFLYFAITRASNSVTSLQSFFYPFGLNPTGGLVCRYSGPLYYNYGQILQSNNFQPFALTDQVKSRSGTLTPVYSSTTGSFTTMTMNSLTEAYWERDGLRVMVTGIIATDDVVLGTAAGNLELSTILPFKIKKYGGGTLGRADAFVNSPFSLHLVPTANTVAIYKKATGISNTVPAVPADLTVGASAGQNVMTFSFWYIAADA